MKRVIFLLIVFLSCYGCEKDNSYIYSTSLFGKWSWFITCGGFAGCVTPEAEHTTIDLVFTPDSIYSIFQNDTLVTSGKFRTYKLVSANGKDTSNILNYNSIAQIYSIYHDTLSLSDPGNIIGSGYKRIR